MEKEGFTVENYNVKNLSLYKEKAHLPAGLGACHTAFVGDYTIEGHVPAEDIKRLLKQKLDVRGLAVPGMPMGSPGMEYGEEREPYQTIMYKEDGRTKVFASH